MHQVDQEPEEVHEDPDQESLADQALEAIIRSQQLRERARRLRGLSPEESPE